MFFIIKSYLFPVRTLSIMSKLRLRQSFPKYKMFCDLQDFPLEEGGLSQRPQLLLF